MAGKAGASGGGNRTFGTPLNAKTPEVAVRPVAGAKVYWSNWRAGMTEKRIANALLRHYKQLGASVPDDVHQRLVSALWLRNLAAHEYAKWVTYTTNGGEDDEIVRPLLAVTGRPYVDEMRRCDQIIATCWKAIEKAAPSVRQPAPAQPPASTGQEDPLARFKRPMLRSV